MPPGVHAPRGLFLVPGSSARAVLVSIRDGYGWGTIVPVTAKKRGRVPARPKVADAEYLALSDIAGKHGWPSRNYLFRLVRERRLRTFKFPADRKTYVRLTDLERVARTPTPKA